MKRTVNILGILSVTIGLAAAILCFLPGKALILSMMCGLTGFLLSTAYVGLNNKHLVNTKKITPAVYGLILSSVPIIFVLIHLAIARFSK